MIKRKYTPAFKELVLSQSAENISAVCTKYKIDRSTYYQWKKEAQNKSAENPKFRAKRYERAVLQTVMEHPNWSINTLHQYLNEGKNRATRSRAWVQKVLHKHNLSTQSTRQLFSLKSLTPRLNRIKYTKVSNDIQILLQVAQQAPTRLALRAACLQLVNQGYSVSSVCQALKINRSTYYQWLKAEKQGMRTTTKRGAKPTIDQRIIKIVFDIVKLYPQWGVNQIYEYIHESTTGQIISRASIQKLLQRNRLSTMNKRREYSYLHTPAVAAPVVTVPDQHISLAGEQQLIRSRGDPSPPISLTSTPSELLQYLTQNISYILPTILISIINAFLFSRIILAIAQQETLLQKFGIAFSSLALFCGIFFFIYSVKYYITIAAVVLKTRNSLNETKADGYLSLLGKIPFIGKYLKQATNTFNQQLDPVTLHKEVQSTKLEEYPFFSVQIPLYNEKKVANRVTAAAAAMDYPNFEVLVCDDSTDETTQLLYDKWNGHDKVKIIHRTNRSGFKGAALDNALKVMDPRTEYVVVFDADFVPYPDTLQLFAKYFKVIGQKEGLNVSASELYNTIKGQEAAANNLSNANQYNGKTVAIQGYQWHVLNKSENWITRAVRSEFAGSYIIERSGGQVFGLLKQIAGSVYAINAQVLKETGWGTSITEDFQLTLKLYQHGYKVAYTPYIQAPSECVSTLKRLIRQRQRWAEGHSFNIKKNILNMLRTPNMTNKEKWEAVYLTPYYLQAFIFIVGSLCWIIAETVLRVRLPFWTSALGWSLVLTNLFSLPLMNTIGLFLEEGEERDYLGIFSFITLCYLLAPFIGFAALKGFLEKEEGPWFRTPKSGHITDKIERTHKRDKISKYIPWLQPAIDIIGGISSKNTAASPYLSYVTAGNSFNSIPDHNRRSVLRKRIMHTSIVIAMTITVIANIAQTTIPQAFANPDTYYMKTTQADNLTDTTNDKRLQGSTTIGAATTTQTMSATSPTMYLITDNMNKRWTSDTKINDSNSTGDRRNVAIATDTSGNTVAAWEDSRNTDATQNQITASTKNMTIARANAAVTTLLDGRVLFAGGSSTSSLASSTAEIYDPATTTFTLISSGALPATKQYLKAITLNDGRVILPGGLSGNYASTYSNTTIYDPNTNTMTTAASMNSARSMYSAVKLLNGKVLVAGGCSSYDVVNSLCGTASSAAEIFDPSAGTWTVVSSMNNARLSAGMTILSNGEVLVAGGDDASGGGISGAEIFNPVTQTWRKAANMNAKHINFDLFVLNDKVIAAGGGTSVSELYDPASQTWTLTGNYMHPNLANAGHMVQLGNGKLFAVGGMEDDAQVGHGTSTAEIYDPTTQTWTLTTNSLPTSKSSITPVVLYNGKVLIAGGGAFTETYYSSAALYSPVTYDIYTQKYDKTGAKLWNSGTDIRVNSDDGNRASTSGPPLYNHLNPSVALDSSGNAVVAWEEQRDGVMNTTVWSQKLQSSDGSKLWPTGTQNAFSPVNSAFPTIRGGASASGAAATLNNGKIFIVGSESSGTPRTTSDIYDPVTNTMVPGPNSGYARTGTVTVPLLNGKVLIVGGNSGSAANTGAELYDPVTNTITVTTGGMVALRSNPTATVLKNGKVFITGTNQDPSAAQSSSEIYDPITNTFSAGPTLNFARRMQQQVLLQNGKVLIVGGIATGAGPTTPEIYDPIANTITISAARHPSMSRGSTIGLNNGKVLIIGTNGTSRSFADLYDPATDSVTQTGNMSKIVDRTLMAPILLPNGKVLLPGGSDNTPTAYSSTEIYDPAANTWSDGPNMKAQHQQAISKYLPMSNQVFVMGGADAATTTTAELYTPASDMPVSQVDYRNYFVWPQANTGNINSYTPKKPKVTIDSNDDAVIVWQDNKDSKIQFQGLAHAFDANAYLQYGQNPAANGQFLSSVASGATPNINADSISIKAQKICNRASCGDAGTTSGERQWGNEQTLYNQGYPEDKYVSSINNAQNPSVVADSTNSIITYESNAGTSIDQSTTNSTDSRTAKIYAQKLDVNGNVVWSNNWTAQSSAAINRRLANTIELPDGRILIAGGLVSGGSAVSTAEIFDPKTGSNPDIASMPNGTRYSSATVLLNNGKVLLAGGSNGASENDASSITVASLFDPSTNTFTATTGGLTVARTKPNYALLKNGKVLIIGGRNVNTRVSSTELFDPATGTFAASANMSLARSGSQTVVLADGSPLIMGGWNGTTTYSQAEKFNVATGAWSSVASMNEIRRDHTAVTLANGKVLVVGGTNGTTVSSTAELYDPLSNFWTYTGSLTLGPRSNHTLNLLPNGKALVVGGDNSAGSPVSTAEIFDPVTGTFSAVSSTSTIRSEHRTIVTANGGVVVLGGWDESTTFSSTPELFSYDQKVSTNDSTQSQKPDLIKDSGGNIQIVWQAWRSEGLSPGTGGGSWKVMSQEANNPSSGSVTLQYPVGTPGTWATTGNMPVNFAGRAVSQLPNGKILIAGGSNASTEQSNAEIYDPQAGTWSATGPMNQVRGSFGMYTLSNGKVLAFGGYTSGQSSTIYDPTTATWSAGPSLINSRVEFASALLNDGTVLAIGGRSIAVGSTAELYNPTTNTWTLTTGKLAVARNELRAIKINDGSVLAIGGCTNGTAQSCSTSASTSVELYTPSTQTWSTLSGLITARRMPSLTLLNNGKVLVAGGEDVSGTAISTTEIFDPFKRSSTAVSNSPAGIDSGVSNYGQGILLPSGKVLFAGRNSATAYLYDPYLDSWTTTGSLSKSYYGTVPLLLKNGKVLLAGGNSGATYYSSSEVYTPDLSEKTLSTDDSGISYDQNDPKIGADTSNSYGYVTWTDKRLTAPSDSASEQNIYMQKLDGNGNPAWPNGLNENGTYNVRDIRIDTTRGSLNTTIQSKPAIAKSVFTNTATDIPIQIAWMDTRDGTPSLSIYGQSYNTANYSMSSTTWTAYYYVTGNPTNANSISIQVGASEADGETMSYTSSTATYTGDGTNGQKSTIFSNLPPTGDTSLTHRRIVMKLTRTAGTMSIQYNGAAGTADTRLDVGTVVPERSALLVLIIPALPLLAFGKKKPRVTKEKIST